MSIGFLPYGSSASSVIFQHDLKSAITAADASNWSTVQAGDITNGWTNIGSVAAADLPTHDSTLGMLAVKAGDGTTPVGYKFLTSAAALDALDYQGQITFEIQTGAITSWDNGWQQDTYQPAGDIYPMSGFTSTGADHIYFMQIVSGTDTVDWQACAHVSQDLDDSIKNYAINTGTNSDPKIVVNSAMNKSGFTKVNIGWRNSTGYLMIDDILVATGTRLSQAGSSDFLHEFYIGSRRGVIEAHNIAYYIRNLQISTEPPSFALSYDYPVIGVYSDSMFDDVDYNGVVTGGGIHGGGMGIRKIFNEKGLFTSVVISENAGADTASAVSGTHASGYTVADHIADNPAMKHVFIHLGTNDANSDTPIVQATIETQLQAIIDLYFAASTRVASMTLIIPPSRYASDSVNPQLSAAQITQRQANQAIYKAAVLNMETYVATSHPTKRINFGDVSVYIGDSPPADSLRGIHSLIVTGTATTDSTNRLVDTSKNFSTLFDGSAANLLAYNNTDDTGPANVTTFETTTNANDTCVLSSDLFPTGTETYAIGKANIGDIHYGPIGSTYLGLVCYEAMQEIFVG